jgi:serine/threonine protein kinase
VSFAKTGVGVILGTAAYMALEQAKGRAADKRSDIWAFGAVLFEMLTGTRAFPGDDLSETPFTSTPLHSFGTASGPNCSSILTFARRSASPMSTPAAS